MEKVFNYFGLDEYLRNKIAFNIHQQYTEMINREFNVIIHISKKKCYKRLRLRTREFIFHYLYSNVIKELKEYIFNKTLNELNNKYFNKL